ncbi:serine/threonine-protein kinase prpf4B-like [Littorina saxatilis]|uniref:serine/threonine-protein kinase prpf4B-like n=1 Tax=Littorina saxatilis TaxID=31220 RepID=UPI0038B5A96D
MSLISVQSLRNTTVPNSRALVKEHNGTNIKSTGQGTQRRETGAERRNETKTVGETDAAGTTTETEIPFRTDRERSSGQERDRDQDQFEREKRDRDRSPRESRSREDDPDKERKDRDSEGDSDSGRDRGRGRDEGRGRNRDRDIDAGRDRDGGRDRDKGKKRYREREGRQRERNQEREDEVRFVKTGWRSGGDCDRNREDSGGRGGHRGNDRRDFPGRQGCPPQSSRSPGQGARPKTSDGRRGFRQPAEPAREWSSYSDSDDDYLPGSEDDTDSSNNDATAPCGVPGTTSEPDESIIYPFLRKSDGASWSPGIPSESLKAAGLYTSSQPPSSSSSRSITRPSGSKSSSQPASKPSDSGRDRGRGRDEGRGRNRDRDIDAGRDRDGGRDRDKGKKQVPRARGQTAREKPGERGRGPLCQDRLEVRR